MKLPERTQHPPGYCYYLLIHIFQSSHQDYLVVFFHLFPFYRVHYRELIISPKLIWKNSRRKVIGRSIQGNSV